MNRLAALIASLPLEDVRLIQKDLEAGNIERLINRRIEELDVRKSCPTCGSELSRAEQKFSIEFGPTGLRQRAYFDELDCLDYFVKKLLDKGARDSLAPGGKSGSPGVGGGTAKYGAENTFGDGRRGLDE